MKEKIKKHKKALTISTIITALATMNVSQYGTNDKVYEEYKGKKVGIYQQGYVKGYSKALCDINSQAGYSKEYLDSVIDINKGNARTVKQIINTTCEE